VAEHYSVTMGANVTDVAKLQSVIANVTATTDVSTPAAIEATISSSAGAVTGQTFTFAAGLDNIVGTAGNDTINGSDTTLTLGDSIDGGNGNDTLYIGDTISPSGANFNQATIKNVENLTYQAANNAANTLNLANLQGLQSVSYTDMNSTAQNATINTKGNATSVSVSNAAAVTIEDKATTHVLKSVSISGNTGAATIKSDALTSLSLANTTQNATVNAAAGTRTLDVTVNGVTNDATITDGTATGLKVAATGADSKIKLSAAAATTLDISGDKKLIISDATAPVTAITSTNTAGVTITPTLGTTMAFTGGDGKDTVTVGATTKAIAMGNGDDTVNVEAGVTALGTGGSLDGGAGTDTLGMDADDAKTATSSNTFAGTISGFEVLNLNGAASAAVAVNLANLDNIDKVKMSVNITQDLTLNNIASNATVTFAAGQTEGKTTIVNVLNAATNTNDVLNIGVSSSSSGIDVKTVTVADVETINLNTDDTAATPSGIAHTMTLTAAAAKTLNVSGDAGVTLTLTGSSALETINTSGVTKGGVSVATVATNKSVTMTGGNTDTKFDASSITDGTKVATITTGAGNDTITGGAGNDVINAGNGTNTITGGGGADTMTGGTGVDTYKYSAVAESQGTNVDVITNFQVGAGGDVIDVSAITTEGGSFLGIANGYGAVLTSLTKTKGDAVFDKSTSTLYIDVDGSGTLDSADMAIQLTGVTSGLINDNFVFSTT
jgi:S-layer protein